MKRPSGFDRTPERREPEDTNRLDEPDAANNEQSRRWFRSRNADGAAAEPPPDRDVVEEAETVDLSDVRVIRAAEAGFSDRGETAGSDIVIAQSSGRSGFLARLRAERDEDPVRQAERRVREAGRQRRSQERRERRRFSADSRRRRRNWLIVLGVVAALAVFVAVGVFTPLMAVRNVQVTGATSVSESDVEQALSKFDGMPLALVHDAEVHQALQPFPLIQRYAVELIPPDTLKVRIEERVPVLTIENDGLFNSYDAAGVLLSSGEEPLAGVPIASGAITNLSSEAFAAASRVLRDMPAELRAQAVSVVASSGQDVTLVLTNGVEVMWGDAEETRRKAVVLTSMLSSLADVEISHIDVSSSAAPVFR